MNYEVPQDYRLPREDEALLAECTVTFFRSSGPGGQHKNTSDSAVRLQHRPTGVVTIGRRERSQRRNLKDALTRLREKIERLMERPKPRKPTKPGRKAKERRLEEKKRRAELKRGRGRRTDWD